MADLSITAQLYNPQNQGSTLTFLLPSALQSEIWQYMADVGRKTNWYFRIEIGRPFRPRTTGPRSQLNRHFGHCQDIAKQLTDAKRGKIYTKEMVDKALRTLAVREGLPTIYNEIDDTVEAIHSSACSVEHFIVIEHVKQKWCNEHGLWLTEYDETISPPESYQSIGGRTRAEMAEYWKWWHRKGIG